MTLAGIEIEGCSVAGLETSIILKRWCVDKPDAISVDLRALLSVVLLVQRHVPRGVQHMSDILRYMRQSMYARVNDWICAR